MISPDPPTDDSATRFEIDPRRYPVSKSYVTCLTSLVLLMLAFVIGSAWEKAWPITLFCGLLVVIVVSTALRERKRVDTLQVTPQGLLIIKGHRTHSAIRLGRGRPIELTLEHIESAGEAGTESTATLNLWDMEAGFRRRHTFGIWLAEDAKAQVMEQLREFLTRHGFQVTVRNALAQTKALSHHPHP